MHFPGGPLRAASQNFLRRKYQMHSATMTRLMSIMSGYPHGQASSGMPVKFMPYQPASSVSGRKMVVTTVRNFMISFCRMPICA